MELTPACVCLVCRTHWSNAVYARSPSWKGSSEPPGRPTIPTASPVSCAIAAWMGFPSPWMPVGTSTASRISISTAQAALSCFVSSVSFAPKKHSLLSLSVQKDMSPLPLPLKALWSSQSFASIRHSVAYKIDWLVASNAWSLSCGRDRSESMGNLCAHLFKMLCTPPCLPWAQHVRISPWLYLCFHISVSPFLPPEQLREVLCCCTQQVFAYQLEGSRWPQDTHSFSCFWLLISFLKLLKIQPC